MSRCTYQSPTTPSNGLVCFSAGSPRPAFGYNDGVDEEFRNRRSVALQVGAMVVLVAALVLMVVFLLRGGGGPAQPLNAYDAMSLWRSASAVQKRATAEMLLAEM